MGFAVNDRREVEGMLSKLTTTYDALGKSHRDVELLLRMNPHWPESVKSALSAWQEAIWVMLSAFRSMELSVCDVINRELPPGS